MIILQEIVRKAKKEDRIENKYRYLDYNIYALGQIGEQFVEFLEKKVADNKIDISEKNAILKHIALNPELQKSHISQNKKEFLLRNIDNSASLSYEGNLVFPREELSYLKTYGESLKNSLSLKFNIYSDNVVQEIFNIIELKRKSFISITNGDVSTLPEIEDMKKEFLSLIEKNVKFSIFSGSRYEYDLGNIRDEKNQKVRLNLSETKECFPILKNGKKIPILLKSTNSSLSRENLDYANMLNIVLNGSVSEFSDMNSRLTNFESESYNVLNKKLNFSTSERDLMLEFEKPNPNLEKVIEHFKYFLLDFAIEVSAYEDYSDNTLSMYDIKIKILKAYDIIYKNFEKIYKESNLNMNDDSSINITKKLKAIKEYYKIVTKDIKNTFKHSLSSIQLMVNDNNKHKSFEFSENYNMMKAAMDAYIKNDTKSLMVAGPAGIGKTHQTELLTEIFGGMVIKPTSGTPMGAFTEIFQKGKIDFNANRKTQTIPELIVEMINGENSNSFGLFDEFGRILADLTKANKDFNLASLLTKIEMLYDKRKNLTVDGVYGEQIGLNIARHCNFVSTTNEINSNIAGEIERRFKFIFPEFSQLLDAEHLKTLMRPILYNNNIQEAIDTINNPRNPQAFLYRIEKIVTTLDKLFSSSKIDLSKNKDVLEILKSKNHYNTFIKNLSKSKSTETKELQNIFKSLKDENIDIIHITTAIYVKNEFTKILDDFDKYLNNNKSEIDTLIYDADPMVMADNLYAYKVEYIKTKTSLSNIKKDYNLNVDIDDFIKNNGIGMESVKILSNTYALDLQDIKERYSFIELNILNSYMSLNIFDEDRHHLSELGVIPNNIGMLHALAGDFIADSDSIIKDKVMYDNILDNTVNTMVHYNKSIVERYNAIQANRSTKSFSTSDAPIAGIDWGLNAITSLIDSKGIITPSIQDDLYKATRRENMKNSLDFSVDNGYFIRNTDSNISLNM